MPSVTTTNTVSSSGIRLMRKTSCVGGANDQSANSSSQHANPDRKSLRDQPNVGKYKLIRTLGRGNFAKVKLAQHVSTGREVAVKVIDKTQLNQASLKKLFREVNIMKMLNHPNIVRLYEVIESERHVYLVMEYAENGEVFDHLVAHGRMKEREARAAFRQIVSAVEYCHQKKIVHRDLKAENLLFDGYFNIKLADFGFSNLFDGAKKLDTFCGSPPYAAPELFQGRKYDGPEVDVWSLGVILYTLVSGSLPFDAQHLKDLQERVLRGKYRVPFYMSTDCEALLRKLLVLNPSKRITLRNVMSDKWLNIGYEDNVLKPYVEPPPDNNDAERLEIMRKMGYRPDDVREALIKQSFNNVTAIYLLLADPKTRLTLPAGSLSPSNQAQSLQGNIASNHHHHKSSSSEDVAANSTVTVGAVDEATTSKVQSILDNTNGNNSKLKTNQNGLTHQQKKSCDQHVDGASQYNGVRRSSGISWIKQSASAGPTSNRQEKLSVDEKSRLLPRIRVSDLRERGNDSALDNSGQVEIDESNETTELSNCGVEQSTVRRINTFSMSDKVRPSGSDPQSPSLKCPLSRAPPMSNIPNSLTATTPITSSSENSPSKQPVDKSSSSSASSSSPSKDNNDNLKKTPFSEQPVKLNKAVPYTEENPSINSNSFFGWLRRTLPYRKHHKDTSVHSKPTTVVCSNSNKIPSNAIQDNLIIDVLDPNDRQKYQQDYVNCPTTLYSIFNNNATNNGTKSKRLKKVTNQSDDQKPSESFAFNESHSSTLDASSSSCTMNSTRVTHHQHNNQSSSPSRQIPLPDSIFKALDTDENSEKKSDSKSHVFKSPTTTASIKRDSLIKWSVRHRPNNTITSNSNNRNDISSTEPKQLICKRDLDANQSMKQSTELKKSDSSMNVETPTTMTSKNESSSASSRPGRFFRSLTLRIARSHHHHQHTNRIISSMRKSNKPNNNTNKTVNSKSVKTNLMKLNNKEEITDYNASNRLHSSSSATSSSHPSSTTTQHDDENDDTMKCYHASVNPDPWITMEPGYQQQQQQQNQRKISTNITSKWKRSSSSELDTSKLKRHPPLHHHGFEFPFNTPANESVIAGSQQKIELEPPCLNVSTTKTTIITSDIHKCKAATITTPQSTISPMLTTVFTTRNTLNTTSSYVESSNSQQPHHSSSYYYYDDVNDQNESRKLWKPRRLHFVLHLPIIGNDPYILLMKLIDTLKHYQCTYQFLSSYRLRCTKLLNSSSLSINSNDVIPSSEQYTSLLTCIPSNTQQLTPPQSSLLFTMNTVDKYNLLTWDMEIFQLAKPINYGVRFKRISGKRNAFKIIRKYFLQEIT
ncbi:hypothetical protein MN116_004526 [Schistosoma mekongi]|uniref:non-specific serine/threonine protein kinase n=1 Tax=Schistosoma mekongi TaxID=38744 RepID=A0AAE1ZGU1_SCHME|nr:hypothetical protein MN116_004526 [Schistosoma mekongi]